MMALPFDETTAEALRAFRVHGLASGHSDRTITARDATIRRLGQHVDISQVTEGELVEWLASLAGQDLRRSSLATYRAHLMAFFRWMRKTGRRADNPAAELPSARAPRGVPHPVKPDELVAILDACADPRARTTRVMVLLAAYEGLRVSEIAKIRGEDLTGGELHVEGKGGTVSTVPIHPAVEAVARTMPRRGWWFPSPSSPRGHVSRVSVSLAISRAMQRADVNNTPHGLRHHFGTQVLRASGGDLRTTQRALRHASPSTTAIYTQVANDTLQRAVTSVPCSLPCCDPGQATPTGRVIDIMRNSNRPSRNRAGILLTLLTLAGCSTAGEAVHPALSQTATAIAPTSSSPAPTTETPTPEPTFSGTPADFTIAVKILRRQCFGSAGCNVSYRIDPTYVGAGELPDKGTVEVTYVVKGLEDGDAINTFTIADHRASFDSEETGSVTSSKAKLTAAATDVAWQP